MHLSTPTKLTHSKVPPERLVLICRIIGPECNEELPDELGTGSEEKEGKDQHEVKISTPGFDVLEVRRDGDRTHSHLLLGHHLVGLSRRALGAALGPFFVFSLLFLLLLNAETNLLHELGKCFAVGKELTVGALLQDFTLRNV